MKTNQTIYRTPKQSKAQPSTFEQALESLAPLLNKIAFASRIPGMDYSDVHQELIEALWVSWREYDASRGVKFISYAYPALQNRRNMLIRSANAQFRGAGHSPMPFDIDCATDKDESVSLLDVIAADNLDMDDYIELKEKIAIVNQVIESSSSPKVKQLLRDMMAGCTQVEASRRNNCTQSLVNYHFDAFRKRVEREFITHGYPV